MQGSLGRALSILLSSMLLAPSLSWSQDTRSLRIVVVAGQGAIHNIIRQVAVEPIVEIQDEQGRPVAGATVVFSSPPTGPSATFLGGAYTMAVKTSESGRARARGMVPNTQEGSYAIEVTATHGSLRTTADIYQTNGVPGRPASRKKPFAWKLLAGIVAGAAAGIVVAVQQSDKSGPSQPTSVTLGTVRVGPPR